MLPMVWMPNGAYPASRAALNQSASTLYYAAAPDMRTQGFYGSIALAVMTPGAPVTPRGGGY